MNTDKELHLDVLAMRDEDALRERQAIEESEQRVSDRFHAASNNNRRNPFEAEEG